MGKKKYLGQLQTCGADTGIRKTPEECLPVLLGFDIALAGTDWNVLALWESEAGSCSGAPAVQGKLQTHRPCCSPSHSIAGEGENFLPRLLMHPPSHGTGWEEITALRVPPARVSFFFFFFFGETIMFLTWNCSFDRASRVKIRVSFAVLLWGKIQTPVNALERGLSFSVYLYSTRPNGQATCWPPGSSTI